MTSPLSAINRRASKPTPAPPVALQVGIVVDELPGNRLKVEILGSEPIGLPALPGNYVKGGAVNVQWDAATDRPLLVYGPAEGGEPGDGRPVVTVGGALAADLEARERAEEAAEKVGKAREELAAAKELIEQTGEELGARLDSAEGAVAATGDLLAAVRTRVGSKRWAGETFDSPHFTWAPLGLGRVRFVSKYAGNDFVQWGFPTGTPTGAAAHTVDVVFPAAGTQTVTLATSGPAGGATWSGAITLTAAMMTADYGWVDMEWPEVDWSNAEIALSQLTDAGVLDPDVLGRLFQDVVVSGISVATEAFIGGNAILEGEVQARHITASESLWAKFAAFARVTTDMLLVGAMNLLPDPRFTDAALTEGRRVRANSTVLSGGFQTQGLFYFVPSTIPADVRRYAIPVTAGETYRVSIPATLTAGAVPTAARIESWNASAGGRTLHTVAAPTYAAGVLSYSWTVPTGVAFMAPVVSHATTFTVQPGASVERMVDSRLIVAGGVTLEHLNVVSTDENGYSWRLDESGFVSVRPSDAEAMHLGGMGLRFWDPDGNLTISLDSATGRGKWTGRYDSGRPGEAGVSIIPFTESTSGDVGVFITRSVGSVPGGTTAGMWVNNPSAAGAQPLNLRGDDGGGVIVFNGLQVVGGPFSSGNVTVGDITYTGILRSAGDRHSLEDKPTYLRAGIEAISGGRPAVFANTNGRIDVASSSGRYKVNRDPMTLDYAERILDLDPITYYSRSHADRLAELLTREANGEEITPEEWAEVEYLRPFPGVLAEQVEAVGLQEFVFYNVDAGDPDDTSKWVVDGVRYAEMVTPLILVTRDHRDQLGDHHDRIAELESRLSALEASR